MTERHTRSQESILSFDYDPNLLSTTSRQHEKNQNSKKAIEFAVQTDVTVSNRKETPVVPKGVEVAVQTAYTLSKSESTNSSITAQLQVEKTHEDIEPSIIISDSYQITETRDKKVESFDDEIPNLPVKKLVSVVHNDVITRRCDYQQCKVSDDSGKQSEKHKKYPTTEDVEIDVDDKPRKQFGQNDFNDKEVGQKNSFQIPNFQQIPTVISKDHYEVVLMSETDMSVTPDQVMSQYVHTLVPLSDEHTTSVEGLVHQHRRSLNFSEFIELNTEDHVTGKLKKVASEENISLWGIVSETGSDDSSIDSNASVYEYPAKKERAISHIDKLNGSNTSVYSITSTRQSVIKTTQTRMIFETKQNADNNMLRKERPSFFNNEFASQFKGDPEEELDPEGNEVEILIKYDAPGENPEDFENISNTEVTETKDVRPKSAPLPIATVELTKTNVYYMEEHENVSTPLLHDGSPLSIQLSVDGGWKTDPAVTPDKGKTGAMSYVVEPESDPITMSIPAGDENIVLTITSRVVKKDGDNIAFGKPSSNAERKKDVKSPQKAPEKYLGISNGNYNDPSTIKRAADATPEESKQSGSYVNESRSVVYEAIADGITPLRNTLETIRQRLAKLERDTAEPLIPTCLERTHNCEPPGCRFLDDLYTRPSRYVHECHRYEPRLCWHPPPFHDQDFRYQPALSTYQEYQDPPCRTPPTQYQGPRRSPSPNQYQGSRYQPVPMSTHDQRSLCPLAEMYVTLSQPRNVVPDSRERVERAVTGARPNQKNADARNQSVLGNIDARCTKCGSEDVELRKKNQGKDGGGAGQQASSNNNNNNNNNSNNSNSNNSYNNNSNNSNNSNSNNSYKNNSNNSF